MYYEYNGLNKFSIKTVISNSSSAAQLMENISTISNHFWLLCKMWVGVLTITEALWYTPTPFPIKL